VRYAIIADIHSNLDALNAVLEDMRGRELKHVMCLGNIVGGGPNPIECLDIVRERCFISMLGIHDYALVHNVQLGNERAAKALAWARSLVESGDAELAAKRWKFLEGMPERYDKNGIAFVHGSPRDPVNEPLFPEDCIRNEQKLNESFQGFDKVLFVAHSHIAGVFVTEGNGFEFKYAAELDYNFHYRKGTKVIICVGSTGAPRDGDPRACYIEIDKNHMSWHRVEYDIGAVAAKIEAQPVLAPVFARRLREAY
jgi:diadenosine tetraphosphatase ApaH/serine/threonine PP2A family protein phosphatase